MNQIEVVAPYECYDKLITIYEKFAIPVKTNINNGIDYPWTKFPPNGQSFNFYGQIATPPIDGAFHNVISINGENGILVPVGFDGAINAYSANFTGGGFVDGSGDLVWQILANGVAVKNYDLMLTERGDPNQPIPVNTIRIYSGQLIQFVVQHAVNPTLNVGFIICSLGGYFYPNT